MKHISTHRFFAFLHQQLFAKKIKYSRNCTFCFKLSFAEVNKIDTRVVTMGVVLEAHVINEDLLHDSFTRVAKDFKGLRLDKKIM